MDLLEGAVMRMRMDCLRRWAGGAIALLLAVALASGVARGGSHYTYCAMMGAVSAAPCCAHAHGRAPSAPEARTIELDCCKDVAVPSLPTAHAPPPLPQAPFAPLVAALPSMAVLDAVVRESAQLSSPRFHERPRDGNTRSRAEARAKLMVFLT